MDGFGIGREDLSALKKEGAVRVLSLAGEIMAGPIRRGFPPLSPGTTLKVATGAPVPPEMVAVIPKERVVVKGRKVELKGAVREGENIRQRGEEAGEGEQLLGRGKSLGPNEIALLMYSGKRRVQVYRKPRVAVITTGDEVRSAGVPLLAGTVRNTNLPFLYGWFRREGIPLMCFRHLPDRREALREGIERFLERADLIVTTGSASVGDRDYLKEVARDLSFKIWVEKVLQKPGKPTFFATRGDQVWLGLPGNPAAVFTGMAVYGVRVLDRMQGAESPRPHLFSGLLSRKVRGGERLRWLRCRMRVERGVVWLDPLDGQESHKILNLRENPVLAEIPPGRAFLRRGEVVSFLTPGN
jgi:molybdopterin molybdotransferase